MAHIGMPPIASVEDKEQYYLKKKTLISVLFYRPQFKTLLSHPVKEEGLLYPSQSGDGNQKWLEIGMLLSHFSHV